MQRSPLSRIFNLFSCDHCSEACLWGTSVHVQLNIFCKSYRCLFQDCYTDLSNIAIGARKSKLKCNQKEYKSEGNTHGSNKHPHKKAENRWSVIFFWARIAMLPFSDSIANIIVWIQAYFTHMWQLRPHNQPKQGWGDLPADAGMALYWNYYLRLLLLNSRGQNIGISMASCFLYISSLLKSGLL